MDTPTPRLPSEEPPKPFAIYEEQTSRIPDLHVPEPIGDYSELPTGLANLTYDQAGLDRVDAFISRDDRPPVNAAAVVHALAMYLCDWLVVNNGLSWRLTPEGTAVLLDSRGDIADPTQGVRLALEDRQPIAHRFVEHCQRMIDI
ncbi:hypothetical protein [Terrabacter sp. 2YAF2]|uniref:hypothetical protein n=1 Tax=Terrabacter sp. 2YAF2 TaxID=3233026 RepID=UPI003F97A3B7